MDFSLCQVIGLDDGNRAQTIKSMLLRAGVSVLFLAVDSDRAQTKVYDT